MTIKKFVSALVSVAMCFTMLNIHVIAVDATDALIEKDRITYQNEELTTEQLIDELLNMGYTPVSGTYVNNMLDASGSARSVRSISLPYSSGIAFGGSMTYALSPIFDVTNQLANDKQVLLYWTKNSGYKKISATSYIYLPSLGWWESTTKTTTYSPASIIIPSTVNGDITQFYVKFNRDDSQYATDFDYSLSIADYPLT